jgi:hypothetical protein
MPLRSYTALPTGAEPGRTKAQGTDIIRVDTKWRYRFFAKYDYRFMLDVIIAIITNFFVKAIIVISRLSLSIPLE